MNIFAARIFVNNAKIAQFVDCEKTRISSQIELACLEYNIFNVLLSANGLNKWGFNYQFVHS